MTSGSEGGGGRGRPRSSPGRLPLAIGLLTALLVSAAGEAAGTQPGLPYGESTAQRGVVVAAPGPSVVSSFSLPGRQPITVAVYEAGNRLFVADDMSGDLLMLDAATGAIVSSVSVGGSTFDIVVDERASKVYAASNSDFGSGTGLVSVLDARTGSLITRIDPTPDQSGDADWYRLAKDESRGRVYVSMYCPVCDDLGVIDVATDVFTPVLSGIAPTFSHGFGVQGINSATNQVFALNAGNLFVVDGGSLQPDIIDLGDVVPLSFTVNAVENKVYMWAIGSDVEGTLLVIDLDNGSRKWIGPLGEDTEPLVFNPLTNTVFSGAQVGERGVIVDGATDAIRFVDFGDGGMGDSASVRYSTDNAYFASTDATYVVHGGSGTLRTFPTGKIAEGGVFSSSVAIDQTRGRVYVVNDDHDGKITVFQDAAFDGGAVDGSLPFTDIGNSVHRDAIVAVFEEGIAGGFADGTFRPDESVTRGQMATFLTRGLLLDAFGAAAPFSDVAGTTHAESIAAVWEAGIAGGFADGTFRPDAAVTRGQMATFLARGFELPAASGPAPFSDVAGSTHAASIAAVAEAGIAGGFADGTFRPSAAVTRGQMATFLARAIGLD